jgi:hypothetical protein
MGQFRLPMKEDGADGDSARGRSFANMEGALARRVQAVLKRASDESPAAVAQSGGVLRSTRVGTLRLFVLAVLLLPARVSLSNSLPAHESAVTPTGRVRVMEEGLISAECGARLAHSEGRLTGHSEKVPPLLRKHSRRPSPSDDDGTRPDPTDEDNTADNIVGDDGTEGTIALWSPTELYFVVTSDDAPSFFAAPSLTPLFLVLGRFRC